jgi:putative CocE/NonD family hydrolase
MRLPPPLTRQITVRRGLGLRARDGAILRTDHYAPSLAAAPTVLVRTPYGRGGVTAIAARMLAEQGFHVVAQSCRGTGGSSGTFEPMRFERDDGLDTVEWLRRQSWFNGRLGTYGPSYVGYTQWAIADVPELEAMATVVTASQFRDPTYAGGSFAFFTTLAWGNLLHAQQRPWLERTVELLRGQPKLYRALEQMPLGEADRAAIGAEMAFFRRWLALAGERGDAFTEYWEQLSHDNLIPKVRAAVLMVGGWHDIFLPWQLADYAALREAGAQPHLIVGPWAHGSGELFLSSFRESVRWLRYHLRGEGSLSADPVRLTVAGNGGWRGYTDWPPPYQIQPWHLHAGRRLAPTMPVESEPDRFTYDPADPTPSVGGPLLLAKVSGQRDNAMIEARPDVVVYTSDVLIEELELMGPVRATVHVATSGPHFDVFVRLCDVSPDGRSRNVTDGLTRVADGAEAVEVELWPVAYRFPPGHRLRVQIAGGAHPRYPRNPGTGEPLIGAIRLRPIEFEVRHNPAFPTAIHLPIA